MSPTLNDQLDDELAWDEEHVDDTLLELNEVIDRELRKYFKDAAADSGELIRIRFDMPDPKQPPGEPTLCVFLYDVQEDLELRQGQPRSYQAGTGQFGPGRVHVRCCYLITYWDKLEGQQVGPRSQSMRVMNQVLQALLNMQLGLQDSQGLVKPTFSRVIEPTERLSSLGNFWQALDDKPRLCLNYAVTIPIELAPPSGLPTKPVVSIVLGETSQASFEQMAATLKRALVQGVVLADGPTRIQLERLDLVCLPHDPHNEAVIDVTLAGTLMAELKKRVEVIVAGWSKKSPDTRFTIHGVDTHGLVAVPAPPSLQTTT